MIFVRSKSFVKQLLLFLLIPSLGLAQQIYPVSVTDSVKNVLVELYNQGQMDAIYQMFAPSFRKVAPRQKIVPWLKNNRKMLGALVHTGKTGMRNGFTVYKADFENGTMDLLLAVGPPAKITGFALRPATKKQPVKTNNPLSHEIDSLVEEAVRPYIQKANTVGASVGVIYNGHIYQYGYGERSKEDQQLPDSNTIYEIGSITKTFTGTLLASFVLEGKCNLNDPVNKYLPKNTPLLQKDGVSVTLKMLADHTSGLPRIPSDLWSGNNSPDDPYKSYDTIRLYHYLDTVKLRTVPGVQFSYSNLGFGLLGTVLARMSGLSYQSLLMKYICTPLKMRDTRTFLNNKQKERLANGYLGNGKEAPHWHFESLAGCGAIRSSVNDLLKYLQAHLHPDTTKTLGKAIRLTEKPAYAENNTQIGLAWFSLNHSPGTYWHNGGTGGFRSYCAYNPSRQVAIVILSNAAIPVDQAGIHLINGLLKSNGLPHEMK